MLMMVLNGVQKGVSSLPPEDLISISTFLHHTGMYYEFREQLKLTHTNWNLITLMDLSYYSSKFQLLMSSYKEIASVCIELQNKISVSEFLHPCRQFDQSVHTFLFENEANHEKNWSLIGQSDNKEDRVRRGVANSIPKIAKVLFSSKQIIDVIDVNYIIQKIRDLTVTEQSTDKLVDNQIKLFQTTIGEMSKVLNNLSDHQQMLESNFKILKSYVTKNSMTINSLLVKTTLLEQSILLQSLLNQYAYETQNLISIINSAFHGNIHSTVLPPSKLLTELKLIQLDLPAGTQLPIQTITQCLPEFWYISSISVIEKDSFLVS